MKLFTHKLAGTNWFYLSQKQEGEPYVCTGMVEFPVCDLPKEKKTMHFTQTPEQAWDFEGACGFQKTVVGRLPIDAKNIKITFDREV